MFHLGHHTKAIHREPPGCPDNIHSQVVAVAADIDGIFVGKSDYDALMDSAVSRLRPVVLAAATTVRGVAPLLPDVFWVAMAVTIMFGLAFGTVLTMVLLPVFYACFFRIRQPDGS